MTDRSVVVKLTANTSGFTGPMKQAADATAKVGDSAKDVEKRSGSAFSRLSALAKTNADDLNRVGNAAVVAGGAITAGMGYGIKAFADFDKAMSGVRAAMPSAGAEMGKLRQLAIDLGKDTQYSAAEAAQGITELAKAGVSAGDILGGGLKGALNLAAAGAMDVGEAAEVAASAMTMFKLSGSDVGHIADLLAAGAGKAQGSVRDMGMALKQSGLVAAQTGLTIEETTGGLAAFASAGLVGSDAGTSFKSMLQRLTPQSKEAQAAMKELGISAYDSQGNFIGLANFAGNLQNAMKDLTVEQRNSAMATIFGSDAVRAASVIYEQGSSGVQSWIDKVNDAGYAAEQARLLTDNWYGDLERLGGAVDAVFVQNGSAANEMLRSLTQSVEGAVEAFGSLPSWVQQGALGLTGITGVALLAGGAFLKVVTSGRELLDSLDAIHLRGGRAEAALTGTAKAAGIAAKAYAALQLAAVLSSTTGDNTVGVQQLTKELLRSSDAAGSFNKILAEGSKLGGVYDGAIRDIGGALDASFNPGVAQQIDNVAGSILGMLGGRNSSDVARARDQFKELGESLANLVQGGHSERAAAIFQSVAAEAEKAGYSTEQLKKMMPQYAEALAAADVQTTKTKAELELLGGTAEAAQKSISDLATEIRGFGDAALSADAAEAAFQASIDEATASIATHGWTVNEARTALDLSTEAGRSNSAALREIATTGREASASVLELGGSTDEAKAKMQSARDEFIVAAQAAGLTAEAAADLANKYGLIPSNVNTAVAVSGTEAAKEQVRGLLSLIEQVRAMNGTTATVGVRYVVTGSLPNGGQNLMGGSTANADGGMHERTSAGLVKAYAWGGIHAPAIGAQPPQIRPAGGRGILWAERGAGPWEAFISGHPAKSSRSRAIASDVVGRLGGAVMWNQPRAFADGAMVARTSYQSGSARADSGPNLAAAFASLLQGARIELTGADVFSDSLMARLELTAARGVS